MRITAEARSAIRKALRATPGWNSAFRNRHGFSLSSMSREDYIKACELLSIDIAAIVGTANSERAQEAAKAFSDDAPKAPRATDRVEDEKPVFDARPTNDSEARIERMIGKLIREIADMGAKQDRADATAVSADLVSAMIKEELANFDGGRVVRIETTRDGLPLGNVKGRQHPLFEKVLRASTARDASGLCPNIWLAGPAGSGKTTAVRNIAKALDLTFYFNGAIGMAHELVGFIDAGGTYHRTAFRDAYEHGGCYLFDEIDGSDNAAVLALNAALTGDLATFPDGVVKRHKDCRIFAAANTWGTGANAEYVGRAKLDAAILDRFTVSFMWSYDEELERDISGNPEFARVVQKARKAAQNVGLKVLITPRASMAGAALMGAGFTQKEACEMTFLAKLTEDQKEMLRRNMAA